MKLEEFQAKQLFRQYGINTSEGVMVTRVDEAVNRARETGFPVVIKAQVQAGGRGKAGGVRLVRDTEAAREAAEAILGMDIKGLTVKRLLIDTAIKYIGEYYIGITIDRRKRVPVLMASAAGGVDIEEVAAKTPEKIFFHEIDPERGLRPYEARHLAFRLFETKRESLETARIMVQLWDCFRGCDASLAEINPLVTREYGGVVALDAKMVLDDNALHKHPELEQLRLPTPEEEKELRAKAHGLSYVRLDGEIGCMVNGAGLAMATMDVIKHLGGTPANFLDIGGSSSPEKVVHAMELLTGDDNVKVIFINVFGGITRCDDVARGLLEALTRIELKLPMVVRLTGTNEVEGRRILSEAGIEAVTGMTEGARTAIALAAGEEAQA